LSLAPTHCGKADISSNERFTSHFVEKHTSVAVFSIASADSAIDRDLGFG
jgi:hypothetical protein